MASEDEVRELIGRMSGAQRQGFHVTPAAAAVILAALRFYLAGTTWLAKTKTDPRDSPPNTIRAIHRTLADDRRHQEPRRRGVPHPMRYAELLEQEAVHLEELGLSDDIVFVHIPRLRRFRCKRCGCRSVRVSADWRDHKAYGNGRPMP